MSRFVQVLHFVSSHPWAILPERFDAIVALLELRASGVRMDDDEIEARLAAHRAELAADQRRGKRRAGAVAVIPLYGLIVPKANLFSAMSGGTSLQQFRADVQDALDDEDVSSILIDVDSPGGVVDGVPEAAAFLRAARDQKPIAAICNTMAASAAYWLASQTSEISITPSGLAGSIGVFFDHTEFSKANEADGITTTIIRAGKFKAEVNDAEPLSDDARAHLQEEVDYYYDLFARDVAAGRGVKVPAVRDGYGQGRALTAKPALEAGLVDRIETFDAVAARLVRGGGKVGRAAALEVAGVRLLAAEGEMDGVIVDPEEPPEAPAPPTEPEVPEPPAEQPFEPTEAPADEPLASAPAEYYRRRAAIRDRDHAPA